jgi:hypothetical protein
MQHASSATKVWHKTNRVQHSRQHLFPTWTSTFTVTVFNMWVPWWINNVFRIYLWNINNSSSWKIEKKMNEKNLDLAAAVVAVACFLQITQFCIQFESPVFSPRFLVLIEDQIKKVVGWLVLLYQTQRVVCPNICIQLVQ